MGTRKGEARFPLWWHTGANAWCKKVRGRFHYFGPDKDKALKRYIEVKDDLEAGRDPRPDREAVTVRDLVNAFLSAKRDRVDSGELTSRTWAEYHRACEQVVTTFGRERGVTDLRPTDFGKLRAAAAKRLGPVALHKFITLVKSLFAFGYNADLIVAPVKYGDQFDKPPKRTMRLEKARKNLRLIGAADLWKLIDGADVQLRAMLLLGINGGFGQKDCADLQRRSLAGRPGWIDAPRGKTGIARRVPLWPETVAALAELEKVRPAPKDEVDSDCVFLTMFGNRWCRYVDRGGEKRGVALDATALEFRKLAKRVGVKVPGGPYVVRHTFRTVADAVKDQPAIDLIMGHAEHGVSQYYRERIEDARLEAVVNHVRTWLIAGKPVR